MFSRHSERLRLGRLIRGGRALRSAGPSATLVAYRAKRLGAQQKLLEFAALVRHLRRNPPDVVVEIGLLHGGTLWAWCQIAADDALIIGIDLPGGAFGGGFDDEQAERIRGYRRLRQHVDLLAADSHLAETRRKLDALLAGRQVDLLFIDGDHTYTGVVRDFELYAPCVRPGGLIAFHDILPEPLVPECQVHRFWGEVKPAFEYMEMIDPGDVSAHGPWGGIGILKQPAPSRSG